MMTILSPEPLKKENRVMILDSLRGMALLGILLMNIPYFGNPHQLNYNLEILQEYSGPNYWSWWVVNGLFEGTMRGIFSMLFGAGALLLIDRLEKKPVDGINPADVYYRRLIWLLLFGMVNAYVFNWAGDILYSYAICGLFLFPFRKMRARHLLIFGFFFLIFSTLQYTSKIRKAGKIREKGEVALKLQAEKKNLTQAQKNDLEALKEYKAEHSREHFKMKMKETTEGMRMGYFEVQDQMAEVNSYIQTKDFYNEYFFDVMAFFFIGMALFKLGFLTGQRSLQEYAAVLVFAYGLGIPLSYWMNHLALVHKFDMSLIWAECKINLYQFRRLLLALGHVSAMLLVYKLNVARFLLKWLANVGQMAFTNYLMQTLICTMIFYGYGFGYFGSLQRYQLYEVVGAVWVFQIVFSGIWLQFFRFGPFEWAWRSLTYWKKQPFLKA
jgi:uncharacterized protein